ncbi:hypothetical protein ENLAB_05840 [Enterococcus innesii]|uniref:Uncharacterized protein n=1 Tax=Enterococcus innesii TaxID=2839759 RepID=A0ABM7XPR8_9ENTE|nr:hypothetical protein ENLAB_05840 [Enterococcus innesii]
MMAIDNICLKMLKEYAKVTTLKIKKDSVGSNTALYLLKNNKKLSSTTKVETPKKI